MKYYSLLLITVFFFSISAQAQFTADEKTFFQNVFDYKYSEAEVAGLSVAIVGKDDVWAHVAGSHSTDSLLTTESVFPMGSVSKLITSMTIMSMVEDELLSLDDSLGLYLDSILNVPAEVTIRQLLNHTSGIYNYSNHPEYNDFFLEDLSRVLTATDMMDRLLLEPIAEPGEKYEYSNTNYLLLGMIIESITGNKFYQETRSRLGFDDEYLSFTFPLHESEITDMAHLYADTSGMDEGPVDMYDAGFLVNSIFSGSGPAGGFASTSTDLASLIYDFYNGEVLKPATVEEMITIEAPSTEYGLGNAIYSYECGTLQGHNGEIMYTTAAFYVPELDIAVVVNCNELGVMELTTEIAAIYVCAYAEFLTTSSTDYEIKDNSLSVYPNPFVDHLVVDLANINVEIGHISIVNQLGQEVYRESMDNNGSLKQLTIEADLPKGVYMIIVDTAEGKISQRVMKL